MGFHGSMDAAPEGIAIPNADSEVAWRVHANIDNLIMNDPQNAFRHVGIQSALKVSLITSSLS